MSALPQSSALRRMAGLMPALLVIGIFMLGPLCIIAAYSFMEASPYGGVRPEFSFGAYRQFLFDLDLDDSLIFNPAYLNIVARSVVLAVAATSLSLVLGFPAAYYIATRPPHWRTVLLLLVTIPFWTNLLIRTFAWILILRDDGLINSVLMWLGATDAPLRLLYTDGAIAVGLIYSYLPFMVLPIYASLEKIDMRLVEAAHDLHANRLQAMWRVILPLAKPGIIAGSILVFIPSLGAFIAPDLLGGGRRLMIGSLIHMQFSSSRNWPFGSAVAMILLAVVLVLMLVYARNAGRGRGEAAR
ncbi:ABC transporter permease [Rhodospirillaceae bacterium SYSU D60014]|uniref:ABC transporter permease n=1 Tax=Virgifigura deserti TaxID=2268457 RepID=UPI000E660973